MDKKLAQAINELKVAVAASVAAAEEVKQLSYDGSCTEPGIRATKAVAAALEKVIALL